MVGKRSYVDITAEILRIARAGASKTQIVYGANLNFAMLREYAEELANAGLIRKDGCLIKTTEKGREYLEYYRNLKRLNRERQP